MTLSRSGVAEALEEKRKLEVMKKLLLADKLNDLAISIECCDETIYFSQTKELFIQVIEKELEEVQKALEGEENEWE